MDRTLTFDGPVPHLQVIFANERTFLKVSTRYVVTICCHEC